MQRGGNQLELSMVRCPCEDTTGVPLYTWCPIENRSRKDSCNEAEINSSCRWYDVPAKVRLVSRSIHGAQSKIDRARTHATRRKSTRAVDGTMSLRRYDWCPALYMVPNRK